MSYLVFARKYRPENFLEVQGQKHVTQTLKNAINRNRVGHAYLFAGPRGVGKTSIARIFAKALNCSNPKDFEPCGKCSNCVDIKAGTHIAVREIDGASNNSVDNVRELVDSFRVMPPKDVNYKIYIIDEVHMLSNQAFNALLKSLEEPPQKTVFILATTEINKIIPTVISRCQRFDFRSMSQDKLLEGLNTIVKAEKLKIDSEALRMIARLADGSMRDAQSLLERVISFSDKKITIEDASQALGAVDRVFLEKLISTIVLKNSEELFLLIDELNNSGFDSSAFLKEFVSYWQELLRASFGGKVALTNLGINETIAEKQISLASRISKQDLQELVRIAREGADNAIRSNYPLLAFEALAVRMANRVPVKDIQDIIDGLRKFSKTIKGNPQVSNNTAQKKTNLTEENLKKKVLEVPEEVISRDKKEKAVVADITSQKIIPEEVKEFDLANVANVPKDKFLRKLKDAGISVILLEHIRLSELIFNKDNIMIKANNFSHSYLKDQNNLEALTQKINQAFNISIKIIIELQSEKEKEIVSNEQSDKDTDYGIYNKQINDLIEIFPGSVVERKSLK